MDSCYLWEHLCTSLSCESLHWPPIYFIMYLLNNCHSQPCVCVECCLPVWCCGRGSEAESPLRPLPWTLSSGCPLTPGKTHILHDGKTNKKWEAWIFSSYFKTTITMHYNSLIRRLQRQSVTSMFWCQSRNPPSIIMSKSKPPSSSLFACSTPTAMKTFMNISLDLLMATLQELNIILVIPLT